MEFNCYKPLRLIELFAGIGSQAKALKNIGVDFEHWYVCELDKYAIQSYNAVHGTNFETSDITKLTASDLNITDTEHYNYLLTYSFPCQDLSNAGKGRGMEKGSGTRSGLLWEVERLLNECIELPQVLLMENVPQVHGKKNIEHFEKWIAFLESKGYSNFWTDLNSKNYNIPQNRNRTYMVSVLGEYSYKFPQPVPLELSLGDMLEKEVDEKYYLSDTQTQNTLTDNVTSDLKRLLCNELLSNGLVKDGDVIRHSYTNNRLNNGVRNMGRTECKEKLSPTLDTRCDCLGVVVKESKTIQLGGLYDTDNPKHQAGAIWSTTGIAPTLDTMGGGNRQPIIYDDYNHRIKADQSAINTLTTNCGNDAKGNGVKIIEPNLRIRKLTPKECWRLMGFDDDDFQKAQKNCSNSQLYKQAGNSIVVNVLMAIFKELFIPKKTRSQWLDELLGGV